MFWNLFVFCGCDSEIIEPEKNTSYKVIKNLNIPFVLLSQENILKTYQSTAQSDVSVRRVCRYLQWQYSSVFLFVCFPLLDNKNCLVCSFKKPFKSGKKQKLSKKTACELNCKYSTLYMWETKNLSWVSTAGFFPELQLERKSNIQLRKRELRLVKQKWPEAKTASQDKGTHEHWQSIKNNISNERQEIMSGQGTLWGLCGAVLGGSSKQWAASGRLHSQIYIKDLVPVPVWCHFIRNYHSVGIACSIVLCLLVFISVFALILSIAHSLWKNIEL